MVAQGPPLALGLWVYISGRLLMSVLQLLHVAMFYLLESRLHVTETGKSSMNKLKCSSYEETNT